MHEQIQCYNNYANVHICIHLRAYVRYESTYMHAYAGIGPHVMLMRVYMCAC